MSIENSVHDSLWMPQSFIGYKVFIDWTNYPFIGFSGYVMHFFNQNIIDQTSTSTKLTVYWRVYFSKLGPPLETKIQRELSPLVYEV